MSELYNTALKLRHLVRHHYAVFFRKVRPYPPFFLWVLVLYLMYEQPPVNIVQGYLSATMFLFFIIVAFGYLFLSDFDTVTEHLLILQINSRFLYGMSKIIFLVAMTAAFSAVGAVVPAAFEIVSGITGSEFIPGGVRVVDFFGGFVLHFIVGTLGVAVAFIFQPSPSSGRGSEIMITVLALFAIMAFVKHAVFGFDGVLRYVLLIFTPVYEIMSLFSDSAVFAIGDLALAAVYGGIYFAVAVAVGYWLYEKRVYGPRIAKMKKASG